MHVFQHKTSDKLLNTFCLNGQEFILYFEGRLSENEKSVRYLFSSPYKVGAFHPTAYIFGVTSSFNVTWTYEPHTASAKFPNWHCSPGRGLWVNCCKCSECGECVENKNSPHFTAFLTKIHLEIQRISYKNSPHRLLWQINVTAVKKNNSPHFTAFLTKIYREILRLSFKNSPPNHDPGQPLVNLIRLRSQEGKLVKLFFAILFSGFAVHWHS